jgi:hypothetical protein
MDKDHHQNTERLRPPWTKGQSGNPAGRPKGLKDSLKGRLRRLLRKKAPDEWKESLAEMGFDFKDPRISDVIAVRLIEKAVEGNIQAMRLIFQETELPLAFEMKYRQRNPNIQIHVVRPEISGPQIDDQIPLVEEATNSSATPVEHRRTPGNNGLIPTGTS